MVIAGQALADPSKEEDEVPGRCANCGGELLRRCPACEAPFSSVFAVMCEECGAKLRENDLFGSKIRRD